MDALSKCLWIAGGAAIGANLRFWLGEWMGKGWAASFPIATLSINLLGSVAIGAFYAWESRHSPHFAYRLFFAVGLCGGFTTFSTFSWESLRMLEKEQWAAFAAYACGSVILTVLGCAAGYFGCRSLISA